MYLSENDYRKVIKDAVLLAVIENNAATRQDAEELAMARARTYLRARYDITAELEKPAPTVEVPADTRNQELVTCLVDLALYEVFARVSPKQINDLRVDRYEAALAWLTEANKGGIVPELPTLAEPDPDGKRIKFISTPTQNFRY